MLLSAVEDRGLDDILSQVSRSFYLSLSVLPQKLRAPLSVADLVARAADTIADTRAVPPERRAALLVELRGLIAACGPQGDGAIAAFVGELSRELAQHLAQHLSEHLAEPRGGKSSGVDAEQLLLVRLGDCLRTLSGFDEGDLQRTRTVLDTLLSGMERDLERFADPTKLVALATLEELDEHCYLAAGCVGEYWTIMSAAHVPALRRLGRPDFVARGVRLGKALQLVNVLRDTASDLADGRCYLPRAQLAAIGLTPEALRDPEQSLRAKPLFDDLRRRTLAHVDAALPYVLAIPRWQPRLRLAALWPLWIGLGTLARLRDTANPLRPERPIKISRGELYGMLGESMAVVGTDTLLSHAHDRRRAAAE